MTQTSNSTAQSNQSGSLAIPMLIGAGIGAIVISLFVFTVHHPKPEWGSLWIIRPLVVTPLAGATGGAVFYFLNLLSNRGKLNSTVAMVLSAIIFLIGLWMGIVLGLAGTLWN